VIHDKTPPLRISADASSNADQAENFRETFARVILNIEIDPLPGNLLDVDMTLYALPGLGIGAGHTAPAVCRHKPAWAENDDLIVTIVQSGMITLLQHGREITASGGEAFLTEQGQPATCTQHSRTHLLNFRFPRKKLAERLTGLDASLFTPIPRDNQALRLLSDYAGILNDQQALAAEDLRWAVADHMQDLAVLALGATREAAEIAKGRGVRVARLRAIKADIAARITQRDLSIDTLALRHGLSPAYIRKLFDRDGSNLTNFVLGRRLERTYRLLVTPHFANRSISAIAFDCGFGDLSYFNHAFRRHYGATPSDIRAEARRISQGPT
jgi:AraC-like DNA-binding protein